jgi:predicted permease
MSDLFSEIRLAIRRLMNGRWTTLAAVASLALGIGGTTAMFSVVDGVLLRPLSYPDADRIVSILATTRRGEGGMTPADYLDVQRAARSFDSMAAIWQTTMPLTGSGTPEQVRVMSTSGPYFAVFGVKPIAGRTYGAADDAPDAPEQVVLSESLWRRRFSADPAIVGRTILLASRSYAVIGVVPDDPSSDHGVDVWMLGRRGIPQGTPVPGDLTTNRDAQMLLVLARLKPGVPLVAAQAELDTISTQLARAYPRTNKNVGTRVQALQDWIIGDSSTLLLILIGAVTFLLLIACVNVANLLLARASGRENELAMRLALGASRGSMIRQMLIESGLLAVAGGVLGFLFASWSIGSVLRAAPEVLPRLNEVTIETRAFAFACAVTLITGLVFGLWPAIRASRPDLIHALGLGPRTSQGRERRRLQQSLVLAELAIAQILLVGAGLLLVSFARLTAIEPGFDPKNVLTVELSLPAAKYADSARRTLFNEQLLERLRALPGVQDVAMTLSLPMTSAINRTVFLEGRPDPARDSQDTQFIPISESYFDLLRVPVQRGRPFASTDDAGTPNVAIVNQAFVRRFFSNEDPIGKRIGFGKAGTPGYWRTIVGIAGDTRSRALQRPPLVTAYVPFRQDRETWTVTAFLVKTAVDGATLADNVRREVVAVDPDQPVSRVRPLVDAMSRSIAVQRFTMLLVTAFSALALLLAAIGTFGVMSHIIAGRTREIGVRMALGATSRDVRRLVLGQSARLVGAAALLGIVGAALLSQGMTRLLFEVRPRDPWTMATSAVVLTMVGLLASYLLLRRTLARNPLVSLRSE